MREAFGRLGYSDVRDEQLEAAREFLRGQDVFVSLPTGSGKSCCYGCLPLAFNSLRKSSSSVVIVISPLKALMLDQTQIFNAKGIEAIYAGDELDEKVYGQCQVWQVCVSLHKSRGYHWRLYVERDASITNLSREPRCCRGGRSSLC